MNINLDFATEEWFDRYIEQYNYLSQPKDEPNIMRHFFTDMTGIYIQGITVEYNHGIIFEISDINSDRLKELLNINVKYKDKVYTFSNMSADIAANETDPYIKILFKSQ